MLLANKNYTPEVIEISRKVSINVEKNFNKWLVSPKFKLKQTTVDTLLSLENRYCDSVIFDENDRISHNQRILLRCEQDRVSARREKVVAKQKTLRYVIDDVCNTASELMIEKLEQTLMSSLFSELPDFNHFASVAYSSSLNFSKLHQISAESRPLSSSLIEFVSNPEFTEKYGKKSKVVLDPKVAARQIGIENCKLLFPLLMSQQLIKWSDDNIKPIVPKVWQHLVVTANSTRMRLQETSVKEPDAGILLGVLRTLPLFVICNHFSATFEDALVKTMLGYRDASDKHDEYYACTEVIPNTQFLESMIEILDTKLLKKLVDYIDWSPNNQFIKRALLEEVHDIPVLERSVYGAALSQGRKFSIFEALENSELFNIKHRPYWFSTVQMSVATMEQMQARIPGKLTTSM
ncbi:hypothetical protein AB4251_22575 [Vibrio lentus]|uniref:HDOD domain-containing protein n=1 Tax=Vibrio lentus TaxID=136468 RepID=A0AB36XMA6_9VIBR|nr:hypothetical protein [Vibrio lentus]MCC4839951.1 hypothetical protein [Vibrio lentus]PMI11865.1 hypothetical protein BCU51_26190 [Vibrio lentus]PMK30334.1 hypothetical protein BCU02_04325 [Vibrio lentus]PMK46050.1 hypothetical protein BCT99_21280 [Vibrio lentus]PML30720.1 hypothetical protein BCT79_20795 [Vibrio lentus]